MPNGIASQPPSSRLSIHRVPAKLLCGVFAPWCVLLPAAALVFHCILIVTNPASFSMALAKPVDADAMSRPMPDLLADAVSCNAIMNGFLSQNPGGSLHWRQTPARILELMCILFLFRFCFYGISCISFMLLQSSHPPDVLYPASFSQDRTPCRFSGLRR